MIPAPLHDHVMRRLDCGLPLALPEPFPFRKVRNARPAIVAFRPRKFDPAPPVPTISAFETLMGCSRRDLKPIRLRTA